MADTPYRCVRRPREDWNYDSKRLENAGMRPPRNITEMLERRDLVVRFGDKLANPVQPYKICTLKTEGGVEKENRIIK